jgi:hypothetical protein
MVAYHRLTIALAKTEMKLTMGTAMRSAALVPRHSAIGPSLRAMVRINEIVDGCGGGGGGGFAAAAAAPLPPLTAHSSGTGQARHGGASQLMKPHLLQIPAASWY